MHKWGWGPPRSLTLKENIKNLLLIRQNRRVTSSAREVRLLGDWLPTSNWKWNYSLLTGNGNTDLAIEWCGHRIRQSSPLLALLPYAVLQLHGLTHISGQIHALLWMGTCHDNAGLPLLPCLSENCSNFFIMHLWMKESTIHISHVWVKVGESNCSCGL